ncbi:fumarylacetoacetate hydrolase, partial [Acinetobacter baumannii]
MLPTDAAGATLVGRVWRPDVDGPSVVRLDGDRLIDITPAFPTMRDLCEQDDPAAAARVAGEPIGGLADARLLAP